jgi:hypothetical protein
MTKTSSTNIENDPTASGDHIKLRAFESLLKLIVAESHSHPTNLEGNPCGSGFQPR